MSNPGFVNPLQQVASEAEYKPASSIKCPWCGDPIVLDDRAVYLHHGKIGRGKKSGSPMVVDAEFTVGDVTLHELCAVPYLTQEVVDSADDAQQALDGITEEMFGVSFTALLDESHEQYCAACEAKLDGDDE